MIKYHKESLTVIHIRCSHIWSMWFKRYFLSYECIHEFIQNLAYRCMKHIYATIIRVVKLYVYTHKQQQSHSLQWCQYWIHSNIQISILWRSWTVWRENKILTDWFMVGNISTLPATGVANVLSADCIKIECWISQMSH